LPCMERPQRVLVFCAHSDDQVIGVGGTIARLAREGADVKTFICSFGELSHPHLKPMDVKRTRVLESKEADKILGGNGINFLGMHEGKFLEEYNEKRWHDKLVAHVQTFKPERIITHSSDDPHPDHRAANNMLLDVHKDLKFSCEVYTFDVWNIVNLKRRSPKLIVDISQNFTKKMDAIAAFKSQRLTWFFLLWTVYARAMYYGLKRGVRYAEIFYKVR